MTDAEVILNQTVAKEGGEPTAPDPFSQEEAPGVSLIVQMRIYDVLLALLRETNPDLADNILKVHQSGGLVGTAPGFTGEFLADSEV